MIRKVEKIVAETPEVASFSRRTGSELGLFATQPNKGDLLVRLKPRGQRHPQRRRRSSRTCAPRCTEAVPGLGDRVRAAPAGHDRRPRGLANPIEVKIFGDDPSDSAAICREDPAARSRRINGLVDVVGVRAREPEVTWHSTPRPPVAWA